VNDTLTDWEAEGLSRDVLEGSLVGSLLVDPTGHRWLLQEVPATMFHHPGLASLWSGMQHLHREGLPTDAVLVQRRCPAEWKLIPLAMESVPTSFHAEHYATELKSLNVEQPEPQAIPDLPL
jgi:replicative DNA helicase